MNAVKTEKKRNYKFDNLKVILIFCVVFGHLLELNLVGKFTFMYVLIYFFHMPAFIFCSGYFSKSFDVKNIINKIVIPYIVFQFLYCLFLNIYIYEKTSFEMNLTNPHWIMWYLLAMVIWNIILPFLKQNSFRKQILIILGLFMVGLLSGYDSSLGYYLSLARVVTFMPFFILGYYVKNNDCLERCKNKFNKKYKLIISSILILLTALIIIYLLKIYMNLDLRFLYGSYSYYSLNYNFLFRLQQYALATFFIILLLWFIPDKKFIFTWIGKYTLYIYLLHGFIVKIIAKGQLINFNLPNYLVWLELFVTAVSLIIFLPLYPIVKAKIVNKIKKPTSV